MHALVQDLRFGWRQLVGNKAVTIAAILCIAIGVGANTTIFSAINVIGVAGDSRYQSLVGETPFFTYMPIEQSYRSQMALQVKVRDPGAPPMTTIRAAIDELDPDLRFLDVVWLRDYVEIGFLSQRVAGSVAGALGVVGLLIGAVGIYGVTAYAVGQRVREIGFRKALGAPADEVARMVVREGMLTPSAGMAAGLLLALALTRLLRALLIGNSPLDPPAFAGAAGLLAAVALVANWVPARRAGGVDPMVALRRN